VIISTNLVPRGFDAITIWPFILIRPGKESAGLLAHEGVHYRDMAWLTPLWWLWYLCNTQFRVEAEVTAYRVSMAHGMSLGEAAGWLCKYDKTLTPEKAMELLA
jgi:hypothetical protein